MKKKLAIITGASRGIGKGIAFTLASQGYNLVLISRNIDNLLLVKHEITKEYKDIDVITSEIDISDVKCHDSIKTVIQDYGRVDVLINNAAILHPGTSEIRYEHFCELIQTNLVGAINLIHIVTPYMKQQGFGYVINIASKAAVNAPAAYGVYSATKSGLLGFNEALFKELKPYNIKVTAICPGVVNTEMSKDFINIRDDQKIQISDINKTVNFLLALDNTAHIQEIVIETKL